MLLTLLAILGVAVVGTVGVGTVGSLVKNRNRGRNNTESSPEETQPIREQPRRERDRERDLDPEAERTQDTPTSGYDDVWGRTMRQMRQREEERAASQLEESSVTADPVASRPTAYTSADNIQSDAPTSGYDDVWGELLEQRRRERENANRAEEQNVQEAPVASQPTVSTSPGQTISAAPANSVVAEESEVRENTDELEQISIDDIPEMPVEFEEEGITLEDFKSAIEDARNQMLVDTEQYNRLVDEKVRSMDLNPNTEAHRDVVSRAMKQAWKQNTENFNRKLDKYFKDANSDNLENIATEMIEYFKKNYSVEGFVNSMVDSTYLDNVSKRYNAFVSKMESSGVYDFLENTEQILSPQVLVTREYIKSAIRSNMGYVVNGGKKLDNFERDLEKDIKDMKNEISTINNFIEMYEKLLNQNERIGDLEEFKASAEELIVLTDKALQELAEKIDFDVLENTVKEVRIIKNQLKGIDEKETVIGKLNNLEKKLTEAFADKINEIEKNINRKGVRLKKVEEAVEKIIKWRKKHIQDDKDFQETSIKIDELFYKTYQNLKNKLNEETKKLSDEISKLSEKIGENNIEIDKVLAEKLKELLETDSGMIMFANNFEKMLKSKNKEVRKIVDDAIADKIKRYLKNKLGKETLVNNITNIIENNSEISNKIVTQVIDRIREASSQSTLQGEENNITIQGNVGVCDLDEIFEKVLASNNIVVQVNVYNNSNKQK